ncbi:hypothetical protein B0H66DRAFT_365656 [Apodospora peruviana]|uniref:Uncharacterized protein n=1 Tax=Apodospora peruviana TaxID=516989 RepID=A0AAE0HVV4_9PEZI|nr:hypothetical protein B0H66DRAFT_365656 [Apodospora peruviana]
MFFSQHNIASAAAAILALLPSLLVSATPTPVDVYITKKPQHDLVFHEALELAHDISHQPHLEKRLSVDFSLDKTWESNHVLFAGSWINGDAALGITDTVSLAVTCIDCWTKGTVTAKLHEDIVDPSVRLDFSGVEAYVDIGVDITAGAAYAVNLFTSNSPLGLGFPGLSVGLVFYVDLVFSLSSEIDLEGGFYVKVADGAFLEASVFGGDITKSFFDGLSSKSLPVVVRKGSATFKADLRLRVQCGAEAGVPELGIGATAELGIYANLIEFVAVLESTPTCELQSTEWWDLNVGAFARFGVIIDYKTFGVVPTVSTTLLSAPTMTQCWLSKSPAESGTVMTVTTQPATMLSSATASASGGIIFTASSVYESGGSGGEVSLATRPVTQSTAPAAGSSAHLRQRMTTSSRPPSTPPVCTPSPAALQPCPTARPRCRAKSSSQRRSTSTRPSVRQRRASPFRLRYSRPPPRSSTLPAAPRPSPSSRTSSSSCRARHPPWRRLHTLLLPRPFRSLRFLRSRL